MKNLKALIAIPDVAHIYIPAYAKAIPKDVLLLIIATCFPDYPQLFDPNLLKSLRPESLFHLFMMGYFAVAKRHFLEFPTAYRWNERFTFLKNYSPCAVRNQLAKPAEGFNKNESIAERQKRCVSDFYRFSPQSMTQLFAAVASGSAERVRQVIFTDAATLSSKLSSVVGSIVATIGQTDKANPLDGRRAGDGFTALHLACYWGYTDIALNLLALGADPRVTCDAGCVPLVYAIAHGHRETVRVVLQDPRVAKTVDLSAHLFKLTPCFMAIETGMADLLETHTKLDFTDDAWVHHYLICAIAMGFQRLDPRLAKTALARKQHYTVRDRSLTYLSISASLNRLDMVKVLLREGQSAAERISKIVRYKESNQRRRDDYSCISCTEDPNIVALLLFNHIGNMPNAIKQHQYSVCLLNGDGIFVPVPPHPSDPPRKESHATFSKRLLEAVTVLVKSLRAGETFGCSTDFRSTFLNQYEAHALVMQTPEPHKLDDLPIVFHPDTAPSLKAQIFWQLADLADKNSIEQRGYFLLASAHLENCEALAKMAGLIMPQENGLIDIVRAQLFKSPDAKFAQIFLALMDIHHVIQQHHPEKYLQAFLEILSQFSNEKNGSQFNIALNQFVQTLPKRGIFFDTPVATHIAPLLKLIESEKDWQTLSASAKTLYEFAEFHHAPQPGRPK